MQGWGWKLPGTWRWPDTRAATIDMAAVGPGGVLVIDVKAWPSRPSTVDGFTAGTRRRTTSRNAAPVRRRRGASAADRPSARWTPVLLLARADTVCFIDCKANMTGGTRRRPAIERALLQAPYIGRHDGTFSGVLVVTAAARRRSHRHAVAPGRSGFPGRVPSLLGPAPTRFTRLRRMWKPPIEVGPKRTLPHLAHPCRSPAGRTRQRHAYTYGRGDARPIRRCRPPISSRQPEEKDRNAGGSRDLVRRWLLHG